jgi:hypothetical protein
MLDKFLGGDGLASEKSEFWEEYGEAISITDDLVAAGYGYDFGDFKSYAPPELSAASDDHKKFAELFNSGRGQIIAARTCYDMNLTPKLSKQIKLLILTADDSPGVTTWKHKTANAIICISDANKGGGVMIGNDQYNSTCVNFSHFICCELSCILSMFYGDIGNDEMVDIGCCWNCG